MECHSEGCGLTFKVPTNGGPRWLTKFAEFVRTRDWEVRVVHDVTLQHPLHIGSQPW